MPSPTTIVKPFRDEVISLDGRALRFRPRRPIARASLRGLEQRIGFALPSDYVDFLTKFGPARYFGANLLALRDLRPVYRYREAQVTAHKIPATGVLLFASVEVIPDFYFAFVFTTDLASDQVEPKSLTVRAWVGDAASGWYAPKFRPPNFSAWLERWPAMVRRNAKRSERKSRRLR